MKRRIVTLLVFLLLGAIVNIAVAWTIAAWGSQPPGVTHGKAAPDAQWARAVHDSWPLPLWYGVETNYGVQWEITGSQGVLDNGDKILYWQTVCSYGLPCLAMDLALQDTINESRGFTRTSEFVAVADIPDAAQRLNRVHQCVPLRPIWPGFAINTLFYAAILWLLFAAPLAFRRRRRIKRGLCPACAYPVGASDLCTECGKPVTPRRVGQGS
jgi:hypothetical protein